MKVLKPGADPRDWRHEDVCPACGMVVELEPTDLTVARTWTLELAVSWVCICGQRVHLAPCGIPNTVIELAVKRARGT